MPFEFRLSQGMKFYIPSIKQVPLMNFVRLEESDFKGHFDGSSWKGSIQISL